MKRFKNILIKVNKQTEPELDIAVIRGIELARRTGAKVSLFDVVEPLESIVRCYVDIVSPEELTECIVEQRLDQLTDLAQQLQSKDVKVTAQVCIGKNCIEIIKAVINSKSDLLIKVANDCQQSFDSNDFHLMRKCAIPVWIIKTTQFNTINKILAAVDLSMEQHAEGRAQNRIIMDIASSLSKFEKARLTVFSCWQLYGEQALRHGAFARVSTDKIDELLKVEENEYKDSLEILVSEYAKSNFEQCLEKGSPKLLIPEYVNSHEIDIVVMGTLGRSGIPGFLIGHNSETVLQRINSSVITLKPAGFQSPIR
ncbi:MAG: universal stress protein E [Paraglaciecola sp.]|jgi:nucleotide-binding universal stress UspA family protein